MDIKLNDLLEKAKKDKLILKELKHLAIKAQEYDLAANIRELEKELFPDSEEAKLAKEKSKKINLALRMVNIDIPEDVCWLIAETLTLYSQMGAKFSVNEAVELVFKKEELFK